MCVCVGGGGGLGVGVWWVHACVCVSIRKQLYYELLHEGLTVFNGSRPFWYSIFCIP